MRTHRFRHLPPGTLPWALLAALGLALGAVRDVRAQPNSRIQYNGQDLFLSGGNVAWVEFARDIGPGATRLDVFERIFSEVHASGGNSMRLWLHTTGGTTPAWDGARVAGPGDGAVADLRAILDAAWRYEVGLVLCLWSFDMLNTRDNPALVTDRAYGLLTDPALLESYLQNALAPMVDSLRGHPGIIAWEIFNEAEGMSREHGWSHTRHVPMSAIQRFVNRAAGTIHRVDPAAQVTTGAWAFIALSDRNPAKTDAPVATLTEAERERLRRSLEARYRTGFTQQEAQAAYDRLHGAANTNYYRDDRLVAAGGDTLGTLDFYTVHYYEWARTNLSPFHHDYTAWGLDKPLVVAEFFMGGGDDGDPDRTYGIPYDSLYTTLFERGYAGAMGWQWYNHPVGAEGRVNWPRIRQNMETMWRRHRSAVDVRPGFGIAYFRAHPPGVEAGGASELAWAVTAPASVRLDGVAVDSVGTLTVRPQVRTTYTLAATGRDGATASQTVTVDVLRPGDVNRALGQPVTASSSETCCGNADPARAVDGNPATRWSSAWADNEWLYVDLGKVYVVDRAVLAWEAAYGRSYDLDVSMDAQTWRTVYTERAGDGGTDTLALPAPASARYVRLHGHTRATSWGFSLWEFEVYGLPAAVQPTTRYEMEAAAMTGETTVQTQVPGASGHAYVYMQNSGTLVLDSVVVEDEGTYALTFGYYLPFEAKRQFIEVNGVSQGEVAFAGSVNRWLTRTLQVPLRAGTNEIAVVKSWGWMYFDYLDVGPAVQPVAAEAADVPEAFRLDPNYPNPFNPETVIAFALPEPADVRLDVYDVTGRRVAVLAGGMHAAGTHTARFDATDLASGVYFYRLQAGAFTQTRRMVLLR